MRFRHELRYSASVAEVLAMRADPRYREALSAEAGVTDSTTTVEQIDGTVTVVVDEQRPTQGVPGFAKKFVGDLTHTIVRESWQGPAGTFEVETPGKPMHISGSVSVAESGDGASVVFDLEAKSSIPLVGGKLEKLAAELTNEGFDVEQRLGERWLSGERF